MNFSLDISLMCIYLLFTYVPSSLNNRKSRRASIIDLLINRWCLLSRSLKFQVLFLNQLAHLNSFSRTFGILYECPSSIWSGFQVKNRSSIFTKIKQQIATDIYFHRNCCDYYGFFTFKKSKTFLKMVQNHLFHDNYHRLFGNRHPYIFSCKHLRRCI